MTPDPLHLRALRLRLAGRAVAFAVGLYWLGSSLGLFIGRPGGAISPLVGALVGGASLVAAILAGRWPALGGALLVVGGLGALGLEARHGARIALLVGIPLVLAGWLLLEGQRELRRQELRPRGEESSA